MIFCCYIFFLVLIDVWLPNLCDYKFIMIMYVILCLNEREIEEKKRKWKENERKIICQEDQMLELTFNFHEALSILTFSKMSSPYSPRKAKKKRKKKRKKEKKKKRKIEMKWGERKKKERKERKAFCLCPLYLKSQSRMTLWELIFWCLSS